MAHPAGLRSYDECRCVNASRFSTVNLPSQRPSFDAIGLTSVVRMQVDLCRGQSGAPRSGAGDRDPQETLPSAPTIHNTKGAQRTCASFGACQSCSSARSLDTPGYLSFLICAATPYVSKGSAILCHIRLCVPARVTRTGAGGGCRGRWTLQLAEWRRSLSPLYTRAHNFKKDCPSSPPLLLDDVSLSTQNPEPTPSKDVPTSTDTAIARTTRCY